MGRGNYISAGKVPRKGLAIARMAGHMLFIRARITNKFGRKLQEDKGLQFSFDADFQVESYLKYQGYSFVDRLMQIHIYILLEPWIISIYTKQIMATYL